MLLVAVLLLMSGHTSGQIPTMKTVMRDKLVHPQRLLEAVVIADYAGIGRGAEALSRITETEMISWQAAAQAEYAKQATFFVLSVRGLRDAAARRNVDAALAEDPAVEAPASCIC